MRLQTPRLVIRSFAEDDIPAYAALVADPEVMKHIGDGEPQSADQARAYVETCIDRERTLRFARYALVLRRMNRFIGFCGFAPANGEIDLGFRMAKEHWGNGYAREAARAVVDHGFAQLGFDSIVATAYPENTRSVRVIEALGFTFERVGHVNGHACRRYRLSKPTPKERRCYALR